jgi:hypothetical protein
MGKADAGNCFEGADTEGFGDFDFFVKFGAKNERRRLKGEVKEENGKMNGDKK